jgi:hypothetical protein
VLRTLAAHARRRERVRRGKERIRQAGRAPTFGHRALARAILRYGATWKSPLGVVRCVSRTTGLTCINYDTGFVASREEVRTL